MWNNLEYPGENVQQELPSARWKLSSSITEEFFRKPAFLDQVFNKEKMFNPVLLPTIDPIRWFL
jgi:hypothetical protein